LRKAILAVLLIVLSGAILHADTAALTLTPASGVVWGAPGGAATGWGFSLQWDGVTNWLSVTSVQFQFQTNPGLGTFTDFMGPQGGPVDFAVQPATTWSQAFNFGASQGLGAYQVAAGQPLGAQNSGSLVVNYDVFDGDPGTVGTYVTSGSVAANATVNAPEPLALGELAAMVLGVFIARRKLFRKA
jgi:hypothetical protein